MLGFLALGASFVSLLLADDRAGYIGAGWIVLMPLLWVAGTLALVVLEKAGRVAPYLFAATGLAYVFLIKQAFLLAVANRVGSPVLLISLPLLAAYCLAVGVVLQGLIAPAPDKAVWRLAIEALICLASGSVMIIPLVILSNGGGYEALFAVLVWSGTILSVWSLGNAALLTAGRTGAIGPFLMLSFVVYVGVVVALIEAAGSQIVFLVDSLWSP
jgi:hypothetical protein